MRRKLFLALASGAYGYGRRLLRVPRGVGACTPEAPDVLAPDRAWGAHRFHPWMRAWIDARPWCTRHLAGIVIGAVVYVLASKVGLALATISNVSPLWPPGGIAVAMIVLFGTKYLPGVFVGMFIGALDGQISYGVAAAQAFSNTLTPVLAYAILRRFGFDPSLSRLKDVLSLCVGAGLVSPLPGALVGVGSLYVAGEVMPEELVDAVRVWWLGDLLGVVGLSPILLVLSVPRRLALSLRGWVELGAHAVLLAVGCQYVFGSSYSPALAPWLQPFVLMPLAVWVALRFGSLGAALESVLLSAVAVWSATSGRGSLGAWPVGDAVIVAQVFIGMTTTTALALAATASERQSATSRVQLLVGAVNRSQEGLVILNARLDILFVNPIVGEVLGYAPAELVGRSWEVAQGPLTDRAKLCRALEECRTGRSVLVEVVQYRRDGSYFDCESTITPELGPCGEPLRYICSYRDVSARNQLQAKLAAQERLASVGTLAAGVAHEINNPLTYLMLNLEALRARMSQRGESLEAELRDALDGAERIRVIVRDLKFLTEERKGAGTVQLSRVVRNALKVACAQLPLTEGLRLELDEGVWSTASEAQLGQVVLNLVTNAVQATPPGARPQVTIRTRAEGAFGVLEVQDDGPGIPEDVLPRIFEPFFTTKSVGEGTGLGLYVCHRIIEQFGGDILVENTPGRGACFRVRVPRTEPAHGRQRDVPRAEPRKRLLLIDDDARLATSMRLLLEQHHDVTMETQPEAAQARLLRGEIFDVVLCDLQMPTLSGIALHARVQQEQPQLAARFMFMSGGAFTPEARHFVETTAQPILDKPVRAEELLRRIASFCERQAEGERLQASSP